MSLSKKEVVAQEAEGNVQRIDSRVRDEKPLAPMGDVDLTHVVPGSTGPRMLFHLAARNQDNRGSKRHRGRAMESRRRG